MFQGRTPGPPAFRVGKGKTGEGRVGRVGQAREGIGGATVYARYAKVRYAKAYPCLKGGWLIGVC